MAQLDLNIAYRIAGVGSHPAAQLAGRELQTALERICGQWFPIDPATPAEGPSFRLVYRGEAGDGFDWHVDGDVIRLNGDSPRGLLYAVYSFLETLGCRWAAPGEAGATLPVGRFFELPDGPQRAAPALPGRCLILGHHAFMQDVEDWVVWAGRNRLNTIFVHTTNGALALGAVHESQYQALKPRLLALLNERGMTLEHGGHGLAGLLPRSLFASLPDAFRWKNGARSPDHNFCPSSQAGLEVICANAARHFQSHTEVNVFHLWADDIEGGGWCSCQACQGYSASDQLLLATNAIAETLARILPAAQISFIAYHDTEAPPARVRPRPNVHVLWAPRMRCYAHAVTDPGCQRNLPAYTETLQAQAEVFRTAGAAPPRVFEYYLDAVLFKSLLPPLPEVIQGDARFYRDAGVHTLQALMTGDYAWTAPQLNTWLFARLAWDPDQDVDALITEFSRAVYGADLRSYYRTLEQAFQLALDIAPEQVKLTVAHGVNQLWRTPPADMGDPVHAPKEVLEIKARREDMIPALLDQAATYLTNAGQQPGSHIQAEEASFVLVQRWLLFHQQRTRLYLALQQGRLAEARMHWKRARRELRAVYAWGEENIRSSKHRRNFRFIQYYTWQVRLNKIRAQHFDGVLLGRWTELVTKYSLIRQYKYMRHLYTEAGR